MDIAPELLEKVSGALNKAIIANSAIKMLLEKNESGRATYPDAEEYSAKVGELLARAVASEISGSMLPGGRMYYNIAEKVLGPLLRANHDNVTSYCKPIQERMNKAAGLNIKYIKPEFDEDRARGIYVYASRHEDFDSIKASLGAELMNLAQHAADDSIKVNAEFQAEAGIKAKIVRTAEAGCCEWCNELAGEYEYPDEVSSDTFARHDNCRCTMEYIIGNRAQDVWTKRWRETENEERIKERETFAKSVANKDDRDRIKPEINFYAGKNGKILKAEYKEWIGENIMNTLLAQAEGEETKRVIRSDFRKTSFIGNGNTASIRQFEKTTGLSCGRNGNSHEQKVNDLIKQINKALAHNPSESDKIILAEMLEELEAAK